MQQLCGGCTENYENWKVCTGLFFSGSQYICYGKQYLLSILSGDWSLFLKTEIPCLVVDRYSSQNVISKANLGVGASYIINPADWKVFLQPSISVLSTGFKNADSYLKPDIELRVGINSRFKPYLGIRAEYLYSYNNPLRRHFLYGICFGIILL